MTRRIMHTTGLEPRTMGGLRGFGFTVTFTEPAPASSEAVAAAGGEGAGIALPAKPIGAPRGVEEDGTNVVPSSANFPRIPHMGTVR